MAGIGAGRGVSSPAKTALIRIPHWSCRVGTHTVCPGRSCVCAPPRASVAEIRGLEPTVYGYPLDAAKYTFPKLEALSLSTNIDIGDAGVARLILGLWEAPRTRLRGLNLEAVGMGDGGMEAIASGVHGTCFEKLEILRLSWYENVTDQGLHALALAVQDAGTLRLPMLKRFEADVLNKVCFWAVPFGQWPPCSSRIALA